MCCSRSVQSALQEAGPNVMVQLFDPRNFRFGNARLKLGSSGETVDSDRFDSNSEASEDDGDNQLDSILDWEEDAKSFLSDPAGANASRRLNEP